MALIIDAIKVAIQKCAANPQPIPSAVPAASAASEVEAVTSGSVVHDTKDTTSKTDDTKSDPADPEAQLKKAILAKYGSAQAAFDAVSADGLVAKKQWKRLVKKLLSDEFSGNVLKQLRSVLPQKTTRSVFIRFVTGSASEEDQPASHPSVNTVDDDSHLAKLPVEVPVLPSAFRHRHHAEAQLLAALLASDVRSTALTAPKSRISSQGMGGVGKTMLTAAVGVHADVRDASSVYVLCFMKTGCAVGTAACSFCDDLL